MDEKERKLYPLKFLENRNQTAWGEVSYKIADLGFVDSMIADGWFGGNSLSELMGTYMERVSGDDAFEYYGLQFPLMVKEIKTSSWQPLQVNVGDREAEDRYDSFGKKALWYILEASDDALMYLGLKCEVTAGDFYSRCSDGSLKEVLMEIRPKAGDVLVIEPGTVFAAGPGLTIVEISECSELTFNIHNWGKELPDGEDLLLEEAFDIINFSQASDSPSSIPMDDTDSMGSAPKEDRIPLARCQEFTVTRMNLKDPLHIFSEQPGSFAIYHCLQGEAALQPGPGAEEFDQVSIKPGQSVLVPSEVNDFLLLPLKPETILLEAVVDKRSEPDSYIGTEKEDNTPDPHLRNWN